MIEIKNVTQIGTPREEDKIYIEHLAYARIREESYQEKRVFVLMGHTERMEGKYATFVEAVIPVRNMEFSGIVPQWNNGLWNQVFQEVKRNYEDKIIVGWALDAKGMQPAMNPDLERVHREHFGGVHQLVFLMDSLEQDETFYIYKENKLVPKNGFFIYYQARKRNKIDAPVQVIDLNKEEEVKESFAKVEIDAPQTQGYQRGRYRQLLSENKILLEKEKESGNGGLAIAVAMLVFVIAVGAYENRESIFAGWNPPSTEAGATEAGSEENTEAAGTENSKKQETSDGTETGSKIPVEVVPGTENSGE